MSYMEKIKKMLFTTKKAMKIDHIIEVVLGIIILFLVLAALIPQAQDAGDTLCSSGVPLGSLFAGNGVVFIILMAGVLLSIFAAIWYKKSKK